jgi:hypothetical protein
MGNTFRFVRLPVLYMSVAVLSVLYFLGAAPVYLVTGILPLLITLQLLYCRHCDKKSLANLLSNYRMLATLLQPDLTFKLDWWTPDR